MNEKDVIKLPQALELLQHSQHPRREQELRVVVFQPGAVGGTPTVGVTGITAGFDWDNGKLLLTTETPLTTLKPEDVAAIRESVSKGQSWHAYQSYKKQQEKIDALTREVEQLRAQLATQQGGA